MDWCYVNAALFADTKEALREGGGMSANFRNLTCQCGQIMIAASGRRAAVNKRSLRAARASKGMAW
jgi:hypothetical protein